MSKRTKFLLGIGVIATLVIGWQVAAFAVHDLGVFELEGNAINQAVAGDDWDSICKKVTVTDDPGTPTDPDGAIPDICTDAPDASAAVEDAAFVQEPNPQASFFTGGGSKDPQDISNWAWKNDTGGLPDKSNLTNSYAASYTLEGDPLDPLDDQELLYFGADRFDGSGDAAIAFWFLQDEVAQGTNNIGGGQGFTGVHQEGDVLVISNFSNGGNVSTITVYEWTTECGKAGDTVTRDLNDPPTPDDPDDDTTFTCGAANLLILTTQTNADCDTALANDNACATVNKANDISTAPWPFDNKDSGIEPNESFLPGEFFEGGINLTELGLGGQCFATALAETRTSTSPTSTLKDFTIGPFGDCEAGMTTQASIANGSAAGTVTPGTAVHDVATITGTGTTPPIDPTGFVKFFLCGPGQANPVDPDDPDVEGDPVGCPTGGTQVGTPLDPGETVIDDAIDDGVAKANSEDVNTATAKLGPGKYCFRAEYSGDTNYDPSSETNLTTECFTVADTFTIGTEQSFIPQDKATITMTGGSAVAGSVEFKLYTTEALCLANGTEGLLFNETDTVSGASPLTTSTNNDGVPATGTGGDGDPGYTVNAEGTTTYFWRVTYDPTDANTTGTDSVCVEDTSATVDNDTPPA